MSLSNYHFFIKIKPLKRSHRILSNNMSVSSLSEAIRALSFANADKLSSIDLSKIIGSLSQCYEQLAPLNEKQIKLFYSGLNDDATNYFASGDLGNLLITMLQCGTKVFDAIMWIGVRQAEKVERFSKYFEFKRGESCSLHNQNRALTILAANWLLFITRGSFPLKTIAGNRAPLPKFVLTMLSEYQIKNENVLYQESTSFDLRHVKIDNLIAGCPLDGWDEIILNRMNLGVAGHKSVKAAHDLSAHYKEDALTRNKILGILVKVGSTLMNGFYPSFHPSTKIVASKFDKFHINSLNLIYSELKGDDDQKYGLFNSLDYLKNDSLLKERKMNRIIPTWKSWREDEMTKAVGSIVKFTSKSRIIGDVQIVKLLKMDQAELPESKPIESSKNTTLDAKKVAGLVNSDDKKDIQDEDTEEENDETPTEDKDVDKTQVEETKKSEITFLPKNNTVTGGQSGSSEKFKNTGIKGAKK